jgi:hypothetical protein
LKFYTTFLIRHFFAWDCEIAHKIAICSDRRAWWISALTSIFFTRKSLLLKHLLITWYRELNWEPHPHENDASKRSAFHLFRLNFEFDGTRRLEHLTFVCPCKRVLHTRI